jgi:hypothetical protein
MRLFINPPNGTKFINETVQDEHDKKIEQKFHDASHALASAHYDYIDKEEEQRMRRGNQKKDDLEGK